MFLSEALSYAQQLPAGFLIAISAFLGLLIGSFLNVVIHRLPKMMEQDWQAQCAELQGAPSNEPKLSLAYPPSRCGTCGHAIRWYENVPLLSYLFLKGRCAACQSHISLRYPAIEALTALGFAYMAWRFGASWALPLWCLFTAVLIALIAIDWDTMLLPDSLTLPLLWLGIVVAALGLNPLVAQLHTAVWGAVAGYLCLWVVFWIFKLLTGKEGFGFGDFKLLAALGAWLGWQALLPIVLLSSVAGAIYGVGQKFRLKHTANTPMPYGPFLGLAGFACMIFGNAKFMDWLRLPI